MCKLSGSRRVPPRHCRHHGEHPFPRVTRHTGTTRRRHCTPGRQRLRTGSAIEAEEGGAGPPSHADSRDAGPACRGAGEDRRTTRPGPWTGPATGGDAPGSNPAERPVQARTAGVRDVIAQPHRAGQQIGLEAGRRRPVVARTAGRGHVGARGPSGRQRPVVLGGCRGGCATAARQRRGAGLRDGREETGVGGPVAAAVAGGAVASERGGRRGGQRGRRRGGRRSGGSHSFGRAPTATGGDLGLLRGPSASAGGRDHWLLRCAAPAARGHGGHLRGPSATAGRRGSAVRHHGQVADRGQARGGGCIHSGRVLTARGGVARHGHLAGDRCGRGRPRGHGEVPLRQAERAEIGPGRLLHATEDHSHPHLAGAVRSVPPTEEFAGPPSACLIDLDGLRLAGEDSCSVLHGA